MKFYRLLDPIIFQFLVKEAIYRWLVFIHRKKFHKAPNRLDQEKPLVYGPVGASITYANCLRMVRETLYMFISSCHQFRGQDEFGLRRFRNRVGPVVSLLYRRIKMLSSVVQRYRNLTSNCQGIGKRNLFNTELDLFAQIFKEQ